MELIKKISFVLTIIGGLNWGLIGLLGIDFVNALRPDDHFGPPGLCSGRPVFAVSDFRPFLRSSRSCQNQSLKGRFLKSTVSERCFFYFNTPFGSAWLPLTRSASAYN